MENETNQNKNSGLGNGFVLGLIVGIIVTLLLSTKRGREILKDLTDKGLNKFSDLQNSLKMTGEEYEEETEENDYVPPAPAETKKELRYLAEEEKTEKVKEEDKEKKLVQKTEEAAVSKKEKNEKGGEAKKEVRKFFKFRKN